VIDLTPAVFSLGSNMSFNGMEPREILLKACSCLSERLADFRVSSIYRTEPLYYREQDDFYNLVCAGRYLENPRNGGAEKSLTLLAWTQSIEARFGRAREIPKGPRTLDIDIALLGNLTLSTPTLTIPHPALRERAFVLVPLLEILPDLCDPVGGEPFGAILERVDASGVRKVPA
jgi:2-amino-4-hydroxy-6-hydroxymethyldihydropteridine diphosphokinase